MEIVIIGTGNTGTVLGKKFRKAGHLILQIVGRNAIEAKKLAAEWKTDFTNSWNNINNSADVYIIAVSDDAISEVAQHLNLPGKIVAHTAASVPKEILKSVTDHYGIFYPLQSLRKEMTGLPDIPVFYDGSNDQTKKTLEKLAYSISGNKVVEANAETMQKLHVAAVIVNNFTNHLYALAEEYCQKEGLDFNSLYPLIEETANRLKDISPKDAQTGPAMRQDTETIQKHLMILEGHPEIKKLYEFFSGSIAKKKLNS